MAEISHGRNSRCRSARRIFIREKSLKASRNSDSSAILSSGGNFDITSLIILFAFTWQVGKSSNFSIFEQLFNCFITFTGEGQIENSSKKFSSKIYTNVFSTGISYNHGTGHSRHSELFSSDPDVTFCFSPAVSMLFHFTRLSTCLSNRY